MSRRDLEREYAGMLREDGLTIRGPGKFEGEPLYILEFWEGMMSGGGDETLYFGPEGEAEVFIITDEDRSEWPELEDTYAVALWTSEQGFANLEHFADEAALEEYRARAEETAEAFEDPEEW